MQVQISEAIHSVLIVEDEMIVAMLMEDLVRDLGVRDIHVCNDVGSALEMLQGTDVDCAILDLWLRDRDSMPIADLLAERGIPFVFSSGSDASALAPQHAHRPMISKPFLDDDLKLIVLDTWTMAQSQRASQAQGGQRVATSRPTD
jgi:CheY-like chemotaxis protein